jgi:hypothetical protein
MPSSFREISIFYSGPRQHSQYTGHDISIGQKEHGYLELAVAEGWCGSFGRNDPRWTRRDRWTFAAARDAARSLH